MTHYNDNDHFELLEEDEPEVSSSLFPHDLGNQFIFQGDSRGEILKKLSHILEFTGLIIALQGPRDVGKSTLLKQRFLREPKPNWKICFIDASRQSNISQLGSAFSIQLGTPPLNINDPRSINTMVEYLDNLRESALTTIIIIDNAEHLSEQAAEFVVQLAQHEQDIQPLVRLVLSYVSIPQNITNMLPSQNSYDYIKTLEVNPLNVAEVEDFIYQALDRIGCEGQGPFNQKVINQLHKESKGYIHVIERLAELHWQRYLLQRQKAAKPQIIKPKKSSILPKIAFALTASLAISLLLFSNSENSEPLELTELALPDAGSHSLTGKTETQTKVVQRSSLIIRPQDKQAVIASNGPEKEASSALKNADATVTEVVAAAPPPTVTTPQDIHAESQPANELLNSFNIKNGDWLKRQGTNTFTLQLVGSSNEKSIKEFIQRFDLQDAAAYYQSTKNGKPWFSVVYGVYENNKQAITASNEIAKKTSTKPWIRPMASIHQDLGVAAFASQ